MSKICKDDYENKIITANCLQALSRFDRETFDCCITDPPYNLSENGGLEFQYRNYVTVKEKWDIFDKKDYLEFSHSWISEILRTVKKNGNIFIFGSFHCIFTIGYILQTIFDRKISSQIVWYKPNAYPNITRRGFTESTEFIIWAINETKKKATGWTFNYDKMKSLNNGKQMRNVWSMPKLNQNEKSHGDHPTQKPLEIIERLVLAGTDKNDLIIDPFGGSGTTAVAAELNRRRWTLIEQNEEYATMSQSRINEVLKDDIRTTQSSIFD